MSEIGGQPRKNINGVSTMETLIQFGSEELERSGAVNFNLENVLRESGVSRGSLYHHFGSRHGLISHCDALLLKQSLKSENELIRFLIESGKTGDDLFTTLGLVIRTMGSQTMMDQRGRRIRTLAASFEDASLRTLVTDSQIKGSQYLTESLELARHQGLIKPTVDIETIGYLVQAMFLGRVLVDITERTDLSDSINEAIVLVLRSLLHPQE